MSLISEFSYYTKRCISAVFDAESFEKMLVTVAALPVALGFAGNYLLKEDPSAERTPVIGDAQAQMIENGLADLDKVMAEAGSIKSELIKLKQQSLTQPPPVDDPATIERLAKEYLEAKKTALQKSISDSAQGSVMHTRASEQLEVWSSKDGIDLARETVEDQIRDAKRDYELAVKYHTAPELKEKALEKLNDLLLGNAAAEKRQLRENLDRTETRIKEIETDVQLRTLLSSGISEVDAVSYARQYKQMTGMEMLGSAYYNKYGEQSFSYLDECQKTVTARGKDTDDVIECMYEAAKQDKDETTENALMLAVGTGLGSISLCFLGVSFRRQTEGERYRRALERVRRREGKERDQKEKIIDLQFKVKQPGK